MDYPISVPSVGLVGGKFVDEDPLAGTPGSLIPAAWGNAVTEEILNTIIAAGLTPQENDNTQLAAAIRLLNKQPSILTDTGVVGAYTAVNVPPLSALPATGYMQRVRIANANTGAATYAPDGLAAKPVYGLGLQPLQGGELPAGVAVLMYLVQAGVNSGNGAWILIESLGGAQQIPAATKSQHAMQLGQATGRLLNIQVFSTPGTFTYTPTPGTLKVRPRGGGGGGAGGGGPATSAGQASLGGAGSSGSYGEALFTSGFSGVTITVGAGGVGNLGVAGGNGGASSFGSLLSIPGGIGGTSAPSLTSALQPSAAQPAAPTGANLIGGRGNRGSVGIVLSPTIGAAGLGGVGLFGTSISNGGDGTFNAPSTAATIGSSGAPGIMIVEEYS